MQDVGSVRRDQVTKANLLRHLSSLFPSISDPRKYHTGANCALCLWDGPDHVFIAKVSTPSSGTVLRRPVPFPTLPHALNTGGLSVSLLSLPCLLEFTVWTCPFNLYHAERDCCRGVPQSLILNTSELSKKELCCFQMG